ASTFREWPTVALRASLAGDRGSGTGDRNLMVAPHPQAGTPDPRSPVPATEGSRAPLRFAFTGAVQDWWYGLIPFAVLNLLWLLLVLTVVAGPPATAAMLGVARDAAVGE